MNVRGTIGAVAADPIRAGGAAAGAATAGSPDPRTHGALLLVRPDALLLDEPTNHLDDEAVAFPASRLRAWGGLIVVASRDRRLRRRWTGTALALVGGRVAQEVAV